MSNLKFVGYCFGIVFLTALAILPFLVGLHFIIKYW